MDSYSRLHHYSNRVDTTEAMIRPRTRPSLLGKQSDGFIWTRDTESHAEELNLSLFISLF